MTSFHMILPSNSSMKTYPENILNHYVTALSNRIELNGDWEVALSEILFQRTWYNIQEDEYMLNIITPGNEIDMFLPEGFYSDVYQLVDGCNRMIGRYLKDAETIVDSVMGTDTLKCIFNTDTDTDTLNVFSILTRKFFYKCIFNTCI